jgi:hypothetical protein
VSQQPQIHDTSAVIERGRVEHKGQALIAEEGHQVCQEAGPQRHDADVLIREEPCQAAFDPGGGGGTDPQHLFRSQGEASFAGQHEAEDKEGERFGAVTMHVWQELAHLGGPLAPQIHRCFHEERVPFHERCLLLRSW